MPELSQAARFALTSLSDNPEHDTPERIANGPYSIQQIDVPDVTRGLNELAAAGLAVEQHGRWRRTDKPFEA